MSSAALVRRARSRSPPGRFDLSRCMRSRVEEEHVDGDGDMSSALPDEMLLEIFTRLPPPTDIFRCAAVCRRWRRAVSRAGSGTLPAPPRHFGFFRNYGPFVPTAGVALDFKFVPVCGVATLMLVDSRGQRLLLRELGSHLDTQLRLLVCNPLERTFVRLPAVLVDRHTYARCTIVPGQGAEFRVVVVLFLAVLPRFYVLVYSSASSAWKVATGVQNRIMAPRQCPSVVAEDMVYRLEFDQKHIMAVNATNLRVSVFPVPNAGMLLYSGYQCIGKTEDGRLCYFVIREPLLLVKWVLEAPRKSWVPQKSVALGPLMNSAMIGPDPHGMKLRFGGFCEGSGTMFFNMADGVVSLDLKTFRMERLNDNEWRPVADVFPYEMVPWPPAIKDSVL